MNTGSIQSLSGMTSHLARPAAVATGSLGVPTDPVDLATLDSSTAAPGTAAPRTSAPPSGTSPASLPSGASTSDPPAAHIPPSTAPAASAPASTSPPTVLSSEEPSTPPPPEASRTSWAQRIRHAECERLGTLQRALEAGSLKGGAFGKAAQALSTAALESPDRLVRSMASPLLRDYVHWKDPIAEWSNKLGAVEGPVSYLSAVKGRITGSGERNYFTAEHRIDSMLGALCQALDGYEVDARSLRVVTDLAHEMEQRAGASLEPEIREKESPEQDAAWASQFAHAAGSWWRNGQIEVVRDGQALQPGSVDLERVVRDQRVTVRDGVIDLSAPPRHEPAPEFAAIREEAEKAVDPWTDRRAPSLDWFDKLAQAQPAAADDLLQSWLATVYSDNQSGDHDLQRIALVLSGAIDHPATRAVLAPHADEMSTLVSRQDAADRIAENNLVGQAHVAFCEAFVKAFPELLDGAFFAREIVPLLRCEEINTSDHACKMVEGLWDARPDLVAPTIAAITGAPDDFHAWRPHWSLVGKAMERGWRPDAEQVDWVLDCLYVPPGRNHTTIFRGDTMYEQFRSALNVMTKLADEKSPLLEGLEMPDTQGHMQPLRRAVFDRFFHDPGNDRVRNLYAKGSSGDPWRVMHTVYALAFPDAELTDQLLDTVEQGLAKAGSLPRLDADAQAAFVVLASLDLDDASKARFETLLRQCAHQGRAAYWFNETIDRVRLADVQQATARLATGTVDVEQALPLFEETAALARLSASYSMDESRAVEKVCAAWNDGLNAGPPEQRTRALTTLKQRAEESLAGPVKLSDIPLGDLALVAVLELQSRQDPSLASHYRTLLAPRLDADQGYCDGLAARLLTNARKTFVDEQLSHLRAPGATRTQRLEHVDTAERVGSLDSHIGEESTHKQALQALHEALAASPDPGLARLATAFQEPGNLLTAYRGLAPTAASDAEIGAECPRLLEVMDLVGGEAQLPRALEAHAFIEEMTATGRSRESALRHAVQAYALGTKPDAMLFDEDRPAANTPTVEREGKRLRIGGLDIPVRGT